MAAVYNHIKSEFSAGAIDTFVSAAVDADMTTVPELGPANAAVFKAAGIETTHALLGKYLSLHKADITGKQHAVSACLFVRASGCAARAESRAERYMMPGPSPSSLHCINYSTSSSHAT